MNLLLFVLEVFLIVAAIALVPARSELRVSRTRVIHKAIAATMRRTSNTNSKRFIWFTFLSFRSLTIMIEGRSDLFPANNFQTMFPNT